VDTAKKQREAIDLPENVYSQVEIGLRATALLARRHSDVVYGSISAATSRALDQQTLAPPEAYWLALSVLPEAPSDDAISKELAAVDEAVRDSVRGSGAPPRIVSQENARHIDRVAADRIGGGVYKGNTSFLHQIRADNAGQSRANLHAALDILGSAWPEARAEVSLLADRIILIESNDLTASHDHMFGVVLAGTDATRTVQSSVEVLLHEIGHHSLFLRVWRRDYLLNPTDMARHPLRPDARPLSGLLQAAYVLARMSMGLSRCVAVAATPDRPAFRDMLAIDLEKLSATLDALDEHARWTDIGAELRDELRAVADRLLASSR
jgi:hypothetical protein